MQIKRDPIPYQHFWLSVALVPQACKLQTLGHFWRTVDSEESEDETREEEGVQVTALSPSDLLSHQKINPIWHERYVVFLPMLTGPCHSYVAWSSVTEITFHMLVESKGGHLDKE